jgi:uncharacterized protein (TIGR02231 family)
MVLFFFLLALAAPVQDAAAGPTAPTPVTSTIVEVTVYPGSAAVRRRAALPSANGRFALAGLPRSLDPDALRVRLAGGGGAEIVGVELRERVAPAASDARVEELRGKVADVERRLAANDDEQRVVQTLRQHVERLIAPELAPLAGAAVASSPSLERWQANLAYLGRELAELAARRRALEAQALELRREVEDLRLELGRADAQGGVRTYDLYVDAFGPPADASAVLEVDYVVPAAGWAPVYDLRAPKDLSSVELVYRARVHQKTGEDWRDVALLLSTAQPRRGAQGPEPEGRWVGVFDPRPSRRGIAAAEAPSAGAVSVARKVDKDSSLAFEPPPTATVQDEGLSLRYRLPSSETVESRDEPATVLVGRAQLGVAPEHYCIPALDPTVWVRGEATNTSDFVLLPGRAAVYLGADFLGHAELATVQRGAKFLLPLGLDPGIGVKRAQLADESGTSGLFGSKRRERDTWRVELENHGALTRSPDGAVEVIVHEALPQTRDDRIDVSLGKVAPKLAEEERWKTLRQEKGALTWVVRVPKGGKQAIEHTLDVTWPKDEVLARGTER